MALKKIVDCLHDRDVVVGTTGMLSRELFEYREAKGQGHEKDFLCVGSMGHASAIALGISSQRPRRQVIIFLRRPPFVDVLHFVHFLTPCFSLRFSASTVTVLR